MVQQQPPAPQRVWPWAILLVVVTALTIWFPLGWGAVWTGGQPQAQQAQAPAAKPDPAVVAIATQVARQGEQIAAMATAQAKPSPTLQPTATPAPAKPAPTPTVATGIAITPTTGVTVTVPVSPTAPGSPVAGAQLPPPPGYGYVMAGGQIVGVVPLTGQPGQPAPVTATGVVTTTAPSAGVPPMVGQPGPYLTVGPGGQLVWVVPPVQSAAQPAVVQPAGWPTTPAEAAARFAPGTSPTRWEVSPEGGWHMREEPFRAIVNPSGFILEGYYDTKPGKDPRQFVSVLPIEAQGVTVWRATPEELFCAMGVQKFARHGIAYATWRDAIDAVGFTKPANCVGGKP